MAQQEVVADRRTTTSLQRKADILYVARCLAVGLKGDGSGDRGGSVKSHETDHGKTSILDFGVTSSGKGFCTLVLGQTERIEESGDHVLKENTKKLAQLM